MTTTAAHFLSVDVDDNRGCVRVNYDRGANGFALQLTFSIVAGHVDAVANLEVRIAGRYFVAEVKFLALLPHTQGLDYRGVWPA